MSENESTPIDPEALTAAREQAADFESFLRPLEIRTASGKTLYVTHPNMLDDDASEEYLDLRWRANQCDRVTEEIPSSTITLKDGATTTIEARTFTGGFIDPYQENGVRMKPSYNIQLARILLGSDEAYAKFKEQGGSANAIAVALAKRSEEMRKRQADDSKSVDGAVVSEAVAEAD